MSNLGSFSHWKNQTQGDPLGVALCWPRVLLSLCSPGDVSASSQGSGIFTMVSSP